MVDMARTQILPAIEAFAADTARAVAAKKSVAPALNCRFETGLVTTLTDLIDEIAAKIDELETALLKVRGAADIVEESALIRDILLQAMGELRVPCDKAEMLTAKSYWPYPTYSDLLFGVK
jgi:glutamine synthetase